MRAVVIALLLAAPISAFAQTGADVVRQQWPLAIPAASGTAPTTEPVFGGFDHDVPREVWLGRAPVGSGAAPRTPVAPGAFMSADVARLRDNAAVVVAPREQAPYLTAVSR